MTKGRKCIALFFLLLMTVEQLLPLQALALTSGPASPEFSSFTPAGSTGMVDLFSGDSKYNIPLMDIDGYPINLSYNGNVSMDDEASWVGLGWNLNLGSVNRQLRGVPDDFNGDEYEFKDRTRPKVTIGGAVNVRAELAGRQTGGSSKKSKIKPAIAGSVGVFSDSYTGIGADVSFNAGVGIDFPSSSANHVGLNMNVGIRSNTSDGVTVSPSLSLDYNLNQSKEKTTAMGGSVGLGYNTRQGLQDLTLSQTFSGKNTEKKIRQFSNSSSSSISFNTPPFTPKNLLEYSSDAKNFTALVGFAAGIFYLGAGVSGYMNKRVLSPETKKREAYGSLYAAGANNKERALEDFMKEKETAMFSELPNLPVAVHTPDVFNFSSQVVGGQFRVYQNGTGLFSYPQANDQGSSLGVGFDIGVGSGAHIGVSMYPSKQTAYRGRWKIGNAYASTAEFRRDEANSIKNEGAFFKLVGEKVVENTQLTSHVKGTDLLAIGLDGDFANTVNASKHLTTAAFNNIERKKVAQNISYLTAREANAQSGKGAIESYAPVTFGSGICNYIYTSFAKETISRLDATTKKPHHISEITVIDEAGKRLVYGIPVYNNFQEEYTFAIGNKQPNATTGLVTDNAISSTGGDATASSKDQYSSYQKQPGYANSFLLTEILSSDYSDVTGNGISADDLGTAMKFNYTRVHQNYGWRTPMSNSVNQVSFNRGQAADPMDNKGLVVYGEKEIWYPHSIETKNKILLFELEDRMDAIGVSSVNGAVNPAKRLKRIKEIRVYSKQNLSQPIKRVVFEYSYESCPGVPNFNAIGDPPALKGKLTLKKVYFTYGCSDDGKNFPYEFEYYSGNDYPFGYQQVDRWGVYNPKPLSAPLNNEWYPYSDQNLTSATINARAWLLHTIKTPTRSQINIEYEPDDYSYVQSKKAMIMHPVLQMQLQNGTASQDLSTMRKLKLHIANDGLSTKRSGESDFSYFQRTYLNGSDYIYGKFKVFMSNRPTEVTNNDLYDYVSCYSKVKNVAITSNGGGIDCVLELETFTNGKVNTNPIAHASWQKLRMEYPQYAFPGYDSRASPDQDPSSDFKKAISALGTAISNLGELKKTFNEKAETTKLGTVVKLNESFVKISPAANKPVKLGGGVRVKKVLIADSWDEMTDTGNGNGNTESVYGVSYDYTKMEDGVIISSGVASNEPILGGEESGLRSPVPYVQTIRGGINGFYQLEAPFGEAYFPGPSVGYSQVKVTQIYKKDGQVENAENGYSVMEFYTTKEFPTIVEFTKPQVTNRKPRTNGSWFTSYSSQSLSMSQGYRIELNDMNGKEKGEKMFGAGDILISSTENIYNSIPVSADQFKLSTEVPVVQKNGSVVNAHLGREIEVVADMYEDYYENVGTAYNVGLDLVYVYPLPHTPIKQNVTQIRLRTATLTKLVTNYGLLRKVIKVDRGSSVVTENVAFDPETGQTLISKTYDEFKRPIYSVNLPAHWAYDKMGGAYKTQGVFMNDFSTNASGAIVSSQYNQFLQAGDELLGLSGTTGIHMWVINPTSGTTKRLVDRKGRLVTNFSGYTKVVRSSYRNLLGAAITGYTCMNNPIVGNQLVVSQEQLRQYLVLNASAQDYAETWNGLVSDFCPTCPENTYLDAAQTKCVDVISVANCGTTLNASQIALPEYSKDPARLYTFGSGGSYTYVQLGNTNVWRKPSGHTYGGKFHRTAVGSNSMPINTWYGFGHFINNTGPAREIFIGIAGDDRFWIRRNAETVVKFETSDPYNYYSWHIFPVQLLPGENYFEFLCYNVASNTQGGLGVEIYNNTRTSLTNATNESQLLKLYTTTPYQTSPRPFTIVESATCKTCPDSYYIAEGPAYEAKSPHISSSGWMSFNNDYEKGLGAVSAACRRKVDITTNERFNPYVKGFLGTYRQQTEYGLMAKRAVDLQTTGPRITADASKSGYLDSISPIWKYNSTTGFYALNPAVLSKNLTPTSTRKSGSFWVEANTTTLYDLHGQPIETRDVLNNYSAARIAWNGTMPELVASNSNNEDVYFESFEDPVRSKQKFVDRVGSLVNPVWPCDDYFLPDFSWRQTGSYLSATPANAHTGINGWNTGGLYKTSLFAVRSLSDVKPAPYLRNGTMEYTYNLPEKKAYSSGFSFYKEKDYIFSAWVKRSSGFDVSGLSLSVSNGTLTRNASTPQRKAVVEKWILVEFTIPASALSDLYAQNKLVEIRLQGATTIDDLRIFPASGNIKTYVYHPYTFNLMAELDENNMASLYEYDDQGRLVRIKKETDRGIITVKESRTNIK